jgi:hypothetical protein
MPKSGLPAFLIKEFKEVLPPTLFFAVGFNLIVLIVNLILADYLRGFVSFMVATGAALGWESRCWWRILLYTSVNELNARLGNGELRKMLFSRRSSKTRPIMS